MNIIYTTLFLNDSVLINIAMSKNITTYYDMIQHTNDMKYNEAIRKKYCIKNAIHYDIIHHSGANLTKHRADKPENNKIRMICLRV